MGKPDLTEEELNRLLEEQKKKVEAMLAAMTPEERADAEKKFAAMREEDAARLRKTLDDARIIMEMNTVQEHHIAATPGQYVPEAVWREAEKPFRFCPNCGAQAGGGKFCEYCGSPLKAQ